MHPFKILMIVTFVLTFITLFAGILNMGEQTKQARARSNKLMVLRVALGFSLLAEIVIYLAFIKG